MPPDRLRASIAQAYQDLSVLGSYSVYTVRILSVQVATWPKILLTAIQNSAIKLAHVGSSHCPCLWNFVSHQIWVAASACISITLPLDKHSFPSQEMPDTPHPTSILRGHKAQVHALCFIRQNERLVSGDADGFVVVWDLTTMRPTAVWKPHENAILGIQAWGADRVITSVFPRTSGGHSP